MQGSLIGSMGLLNPSYNMIKMVIMKVEAAEK